LWGIGESGMAQRAFAAAVLMLFWFGHKQRVWSLFGLVSSRVGWRGYFSNFIYRNKHRMHRMHAQGSKGNRECRFFLGLAWVTLTTYQDASRPMYDHA
jgi:hypothetical protein